MLGEALSMLDGPYEFSEVGHILPKHALHCLVQWSCSHKSATFQLSIEDLLRKQKQKRLQTTQYIIQFSISGPIRKKLTI